MPTTPNLSLPYPLLTDDNNPPADLQSLAEKLDSTIGASNTYTPTVTATTGATATASYILIGKWITVDFDIVLTTGLSANPTISLPPGMTFAGVAGKGAGSAILFKVSPAASRLATVSVSNATAVSLSYEQSNARTALSPSGPFAWASGDSIRGFFIARIA